MNEQDLRDLFTVSVQDVLPSAPASAGWDRARRTRRTRRALGAVVVAVALAGGAAVALRPSPDPRPAHPVAPTVEPTHAGPVQHPPAKLTFRSDPLSRISGPPTVTLSARPVQRALALFQPLNEEGQPDGPIRILGDDGVVRSLDVVTPAPTWDESGNEATAVKPGVLSPDGRWVAFAQTNELIMVDLTTAGVRRIPLDGYLELVVWAHDRVLVGGDNRTYVVERDTEAASTTDVSAWNVVAPDPEAGRGAAPLELVGERADLKLRSRTSFDSPVRSESRITVDTLPPPYQLNEFYGRGWLHGGRLASAAWIVNNLISGAEAVAVLDSRTGSVTHLLDLGRYRAKGCCPVLGWDNKGAVLLRLEPAALARWDPETGEITGIIPDLRGVLALAG
ncbi:hypothetical protein ACN263_30165 [Micromonospora sp. WMMD729]|uniref:hypothetical protein n=1 Tax=Micromonospora sp. WMMD729 TaxID=3404127 RepID=UPI003BF4EFA7